MGRQCESSNEKYAYLHQFSKEKLLALLTVAPVPASSPEEEAYVDALEEAIIEKEQKHPTGLLPDVDQQWAEFQEYYVAEDEGFISENDAVVENTSPANFETVSPDAPATHMIRFQRIWRTVLAAAALTAVIFSTMIVVQAAGLDVFGAIARWTETTFSFGTVRSDGAEDEEPSNVVDSLIGDERIDTFSNKSEYSSLQEALDAYGVVEVMEPTWFPEGYTFNQLDALYLNDPEQLVIVAEYYMDQGHSLNISIASYTGEPSAQIEKTALQPEIFEVNGITFYLIENALNYTIAWTTDHYECYISGAKDIGPEVLWEIVSSMFT